jgi:hypothetical protein
VPSLGHPATPAAAAGVALVCLLGVLTACGGAGAPPHGPSTTPPAPASARAGPGAATSWRDELRPPLDRLAGDRADLYPRKCQAGTRDTAVKLCADGPADARRTVLGLGDSHANNWQPAYQALARDGRWRYLSGTKGRCSIWDVATDIPALGGRYRACDTWRHHAFALAARTRPDVVVAHARFPWGYMLDSAGRPVRDDGAALAAAVTSTVRHLRRSGGTVVVMLDSPTATGKDSVEHCLRTATTPAACGFPSLTGAVERTVARRAAERAGAVVVDPYPLLCPGRTCPVVRGHIVLYRDGGHLTRTYVLSERGWVRSWLYPLLATPR